MTIVKFDLDIERSVDLRALGWPEPGRASREGFGGNRQYCDLRRFSWEESQEILDIEADIFARLRASTDFDKTLSTINEEFEQLYEDGDQPLHGLDIGVASTVIALSAARCIPFSSCNGGCFEEHHRESYPLVAFFAKPEWIPTIMSAAEEANVGLCDSDGAIIVYGQIDGMLAFARALISRSLLFRRLKSKRSKHDVVTDARGNSCPQISLPFPA